MNYISNIHTQWQAPCGLYDTETQGASDHAANNSASPVGGTQVTCINLHSTQFYLSTTDWSTPYTHYDFSPISPQ
jgi:hypothetical protein